MTRKEEIEKYIEKQTSLKISDDTYDFSACNAYIIALDMNMNRSNVSRILNQLFIENRLIKIDGRPTLYISKSIMYENAQITDLPSVIGKDENIKDYLNFTISKSEPKVKAEIVGINKDGTLNSVFRKLIPYFFNPPYFPIIFNLCGENGSGRKYFVEMLFEYAKSKKIFDVHQRIFYCLNIQSISDFEHIFQSINENIHAVIIFQFHVSFSKSFQSELCFRIFEKYRNANARSPMFFIISENKIESEITNDFPTETFYFPKLSNRPFSEMAEIVLLLFLKQSQLLKRDICIDKENFLSLVLHSYDQNCSQLRYTIYNFVSNCLYHASKNKHNPVILDKLYLPISIKQTQTMPISIKNESFISALPELITLKPTMCLHDIELFSLKKEEAIYIPYPEDYNYFIEILISSFSTSFDELPLTSKNELLKEKLAATILGRDPFLVELLIQILSNFIDDRISLLKYKITKTMEISNTGNNILKIILRHYEYKFKKIPLMESEKFILSQIIEYCITLIQNTKIPVLIVCHEDNLGRNYARSFNVMSKSRKFYSIDYSKKWQNKGMESFKERLLSVVNTINHGKGVILLVDYYPLTNINSQLNFNTRFPIFSFSPISVPLVFSINNSIENEAISVTVEIIRNQDKIKNYLHKDDLIIKNNRLSSKIFLYIKDLFSYIDTTKTNEALYKSLVILSEKLNIKLNNGIIIDYIFHGNCILNNIHQKNREYLQPKVLDLDILEIIRLSLKAQSLFSNIKFKEEELSVLYNSLYINIPS
ncbi:MAG: hypothetical protein ACI4UK_10505 [Floccifex sp.]